jgi:hypothetical protein
VKGEIKMNKEMSNRAKELMAEVKAKQAAHLNKWGEVRVERVSISEGLRKEMETLKGGRK